MNKVGFLLLLILLSTNLLEGKDDVISEKIDSSYNAVNQLTYHLPKDSIISMYKKVYELAESNNLYDKQIEILISMARIGNLYFDLPLLSDFIDQADSIYHLHINELDEDDKQNLFYYIEYLKGILMNRMHDFKEAIQHFQAIADRMELKSPDDSIKFKNILAYTAECYSSLQNHHKSLELYLYANNFVSKGTYHDYYLALNYSHLGELYNKTSNNASDNNYSYLAKNYLYRARDLLKPFPDENALLLMHLRLAEIYISENYLDSALQVLKEAEDFYSFQEIGKSDIQFNMGKVFYLKRNFDDALERFFVGKRILENQFPGVKNRRKSELLSEIANVYLEKDNYSLALSFIQKSISNIVAYFDDDQLESLPELNGVLQESHLLEALKIKGNIWFARYQREKDYEALEHSIACFNLAFDLIDKMRNNFQSSEYKSYIADKATAIYENAIEVAYTALQDGHEQEKYTQLIYQYLERNKSRLLLQSIASAASQQYAGVPDSILNQERDYLRKIAYLKDQVTSLEVKGTSDQLAKLRQELFDTQYHYDNFVSQLQTTYPAYFQLKYNTEIVSLAKVQSELAPGQAVINYFAGDSSIYVLGLDKESVAIHKFEKSASQVRQQVQNLRNFLAHNNPSQRQFADASWHLYQDLLLPVLQQLDSDISRLKIIPDGFIAYLPFEVLLTKPATAERMSQLPYALKQYLISYAYSFTTGHYQQSRSIKSRLYSYAGFAPDADSWDLSEHPFYQKEADNLVSLSAITEEVQEASDIFDGLAYLRQEASEANFKQMAPRSKILHISSHALLHDQYPQYSGIVLANTHNSGFKTLFAGVAVPQPDSLEDGFLHIHELYNMQLNADLAILSACETGMGSYRRGEGIMSLGRGFAYAGCPSVLMSLWKANDKTSKELMINFTGYIESGMDKDAALQQAKLDYLEEADQITSHPYFWSAFVLMGNEEAVDFSNTRNKRAPWLWILLLVLLAAGTILYLKRARMIS